MGNKLYVGNLSYGVGDRDLEEMFGQYGTVQSAKVIMDRDSGRSKGFAFVEMGNDGEAKAAIEGLNGAEVEGRALTVNEARPKEDRGGPRGGGYGGGGGGGFGGGGPRGGGRGPGGGGGKGRY
ncbi:MAG: RNA-binding protein [Bdellovibrionota bacterium]